MPVRAIRLSYNLLSTEVSEGLLALRSTSLLQFPFIFRWKWKWGTIYDILCLTHNRLKAPKISKSGRIRIYEYHTSAVEPTWQLRKVVIQWLKWLSQRETCTGYAVQTRLRITRHSFRKTWKSRYGIILWIERCPKTQLVGKRCWVAQAGASPGCLFEAPKPIQRSTCKGYHSWRVKGSRQSKSVMWQPRGGAIPRAQECRLYI
jgi:hypothetical protein